MRETPAFILSVVLHGVVLTLAAVGASWMSDLAARAAQSPPSTFDGFHGNTVDIEGLAEDEDLGGHHDDASETTETRTTPATQPADAETVDDTAKAEQSKRTPQNEHHKRPKHPRKHAASPKPAAPPPDGSGSGNGGGNGDGDGGKQHGSKTAAPGVKDLAAAFAVALPQSVSGDRVWSELPLGDAGAIEIELVLAEGKLADPDVPRGAPKQLRHLISRTMPLLRAGHFALVSHEESGHERLRFSAVISQVDVKAPEEDERKVLELGHVEPAGGKPWQAYFTLASGRHVVISVSVVR